MRRKLTSTGNYEIILHLDVRKIIPIPVTASVWMSCQFLESLNATVAGSYTARGMNGCSALYCRVKPWDGPISCFKSHPKCLGKVRVS
jgi:hypothetical protein